MRSHWVIPFCTLNKMSKHVVTVYLIAYITLLYWCCCVLTVYNILYKWFQASWLAREKQESALRILWSSRILYRFHWNFLLYEKCLKEVIICQDTYQRTCTGKVTGRICEWVSGVKGQPSTASPLGNETHFPPSRGLDMTVARPWCLVKFTPEQSTKAQRGV